MIISICIFLSFIAGESNSFDRRALLLYDGIHYDPLVVISKDSVVLQTTFPISNDAIIFEAVDIASQAHKVCQPSPLPPPPPFPLISHQLLHVYHDNYVRKVTNINLHNGVVLHGVDDHYQIIESLLL